MARVFLEGTIKERSEKMVKENELLKFKLVYLDTKHGESGQQFEQSFSAKDANDATFVGKALFRKMQDCVRGLDKTYTFLKIKPA